MNDETDVKFPDIPLEVDVLATYAHDAAVAFGRGFMEAKDLAIVEAVASGSAVFRYTGSADQLFTYKDGVLRIEVIR